MLVRMFKEPEVARWWGHWDVARVRTELLEDPQIEVLAIERDGEVIGVAQIVEETDPDYHHAALDISLATEHHGQGLGREALRLLIDHLAAERGHHRFTIDPAAENERAIRSYTAVGFEPVGVMHMYERAPDGTWRDGLFMELIVRPT